MDEEEAFARLRAGFNADIAHPCSTNIARWYNAQVISPMDPAQWRMLWEHEIAELPSYREARFWLAAGLLLPIWDRLSFENMRVRQPTTNDGEALIGRALDAGVRRTQASASTAAPP